VFDWLQVRLTAAAIQSNGLFKWRALLITAAEKLQSKLALPLLVSSQAFSKTNGILHMLELQYPHYFHTNIEIIGILHN
jgi:hypothetical protein